MIRTIIIIVFLSNACYTFCKKTLTIEISNLDRSSGTIFIGLFNNPQTFPKEGKAFRDIKLIAVAPTTRTSIELPCGTYAIALYHDCNNNGKCDTNFLGIPNEGYGFSNNVKPKFAAPTFKQTAFELNSDKTVIINLIY